MYIHSEGMVAHRDLKPENIAVDGEGSSARAQLVDFGSAVDISNGNVSDVVGTMPFMAPEVIMGESYKPSGADIWSYGVIMLEMICGINKMRKMLRWERSPSPSTRRAADLLEFFEQPEK